MAIAAGSRLGPYEILSPLGAGGMGEVYKARDPRLGREVAIKVLPQGVSSDADRLARFEREARAASSLNHPNIVTIYDVGRSEPTSWIAMELVSGSSLRAMLAEGALPLKKALSIAAQIADGLARAHEAGILHRDLKPENVMVTSEGLVKILDFGLAKLTGPADTGVSQAQTASRGTESGLLLGTVGYMSPEQARGKPLDFRSDQFALGSVIYEMVTARRAFTGESAVETLSAIVKEEPTPLPPSIPDPLRWCLERCLANEPADRYASTRDLARDLAMLRDRLSKPGFVLAPGGGPGVERGSRRALPWAIAAVAVLALLADLVFLRKPHGGSQERIARFSVGLPQGVTFLTGEVSTNAAISPDGSRLALVGWNRGRPRLYLRPLDGLAAAAMEGTEGADSPFWSPDGRFIAFFADGKLKKVPAAGGSLQTICDAPHEGSGSWSREGTILFSRTGPGPPAIYRVPSDGGVSDRVSPPDLKRSGEMHIYPHFLPDGRHFLFVTIVHAKDEAVHELWAGDLGSGKVTLVSPIGSRVEYAEPGYLFFVHDGSLFARKFDTGTLKFSGEPRMVSENPHYFYGPATAGFSVSSSGVLAYEARKPPTRLAWLDRAGKEISALAPGGDVWDVRISPDGRKLATSVLDRKTGNSDVWICDLARNVFTRLTLLPFNDDSPVWSPDGRQIAFRCDRHGAPDLYVLDTASPGSEKELLALGGAQQTEDWSPDGKFIAYTESNRTTGDDIWLLPLGSTGKPIPHLRSRFAEFNPRFSPDGLSIAYCTDESGTSEVYISPRDDAGRRTRISTGGGRGPRWRRDGRELYYLGPDDSLMAVAVHPGAALDVGAPTSLFRFASGIIDYDVPPAGDRFIASIPVGGNASGPVQVILGWPALVRPEGTK